MTAAAGAKIEGVRFIPLHTHRDRRGYFREILRANDTKCVGGMAQWSHSMMFDGVTKAWHWHRLQTDWWYVCSGVLRVGLYDGRETSTTFRMTMDFLLGDHQDSVRIEIPPGVVHGCQTVQGPVHLFYMTSRVYDPSDELRIAYDDPSIPFDWKSGPPVQ